MGLDLNELAAAVRVSDGAWGTQLQGRGLAVGAAPELWNVENVAAVAEVAAGYVDAGSDIIITNTFGANRFALAGHVAPQRAGELDRPRVALKRAPGQARVPAALQAKNSFESSTHMGMGSPESFSPLNFGQIGPRRISATWLASW